MSLPTVGMPDSTGHRGESARSRELALAAALETLGDREPTMWCVGESVRKVVSYSDRFSFDLAFSRDNERVMLMMFSYF